MALESAARSRSLSPVWSRLIRFPSQSQTLLLNPQGCVARFRRPLEIGAAVRLEGLPTRTAVTARVVNCIRIGEYQKFWLLGLALDEPGNVWGVQTPPEDWAQ